MADLAKEKLAAFNAKPQALVRQWHFVNLPNATAAVTYFNASPPQQPGEAFVGSGPSGTVDAYAFF